MAEKYTYADVIIDPEDPRVEIGKEYYFGDNVGKLLWGVRTGWETEVLHDVYKVAGTYEPFYNGRASFSCIIRKKEPEKRYVPFDLSLPEDRARLIGAWIRYKDGECAYCIVGISPDEAAPCVTIWDNEIPLGLLLEKYTFLDGTPCGKLVEVNDD